MESCTLSLCLCGDVPRNVRLCFEAIFNALSLTHTSAERYISCSRAQKQPLSYLPRGGIEIKIKFRAKATSCEKKKKN